jgi:hypothetical protein
MFLKSSLTPTKATTLPHPENVLEAFNAVSEFCLCSDTSAIPQHEFTQSKSIVNITEEVTKEDSVVAVTEEVTKGKPVDIRKEITYWECHVVSTCLPSPFP